MIIPLIKISSIKSIKNFLNNILVGLPLFFLSGCFTFGSDRYKILLNEKMEEIRSQEKKIALLTRENRVLFDRNLDLEKDKQLLTIQLQRKERDFNNLFSKYNLEISQNKTDIENLEKKVALLQASSEQKVKKLIGHHQKELVALHKRTDEEKNRLLTQIKTLQDELENKEKKWADLQFSMRKEIRDLTEKITTLETREYTILTQSNQLYEVFVKILQKEIQEKKIRLERGVPLTLWLENRFLYRPFKAEWGAGGLDILHKIFDQARAHAQVINNFTVEIAIFTSPRWANHPAARRTNPQIQIGPPPRLNYFSTEDGARFAYHQLELGKYPFPVALSTLRSWLWEDLIYNYFPNLKRFKLVGMPGPNEERLPEIRSGATRIRFYYDKFER